MIVTLVQKTTQAPRPFDAGIRKSCSFALTDYEIQLLNRFKELGLMSPADTQVARRLIKRNKLFAKAENPDNKVVPPFYAKYIKREQPHPTEFSTQGVKRYLELNQRRIRESFVKLHTPEKAIQVPLTFNHFLESNPEIVMPTKTEALKLFFEKVFLNEEILAEDIDRFCRDLLYEEPSQNLNQLINYLGLNHAPEAKIKLQTRLNEYQEFISSQIDSYPELSSPAFKGFLRGVFFQHPPTSVNAIQIIMKGKELNRQEALSTMKAIVSQLDTDGDRYSSFAQNLIKTVIDPQINALQAVVNVSHRSPTITIEQVFDPQALENQTRTISQSYVHFPWKTFITPSTNKRLEETNKREEVLENFFKEIPEGTEAIRYAFQLVFKRTEKLLATSSSNDQLSELEKDILSLTGSLVSHDHSTTPESSKVKKEEVEKLINNLTRSEDPSSTLTKIELLKLILDIANFAGTRLKANLQLLQINGFYGKIKESSDSEELGVPNSPTLILQRKVAERALSLMDLKTKTLSDGQTRSAVGATIRKIEQLIKEYTSNYADNIRSGSVPLGEQSQTLGYIIRQVEALTDKWHTSIAEVFGKNKRLKAESIIRTNNCAAKLQSAAYFIRLLYQFSEKDHPICEKSHTDQLNDNQKKLLKLKTPSILLKLITRFLEGSHQEIQDLKSFIQANKDLSLSNDESTVNDAQASWKEVLELEKLLKEQMSFFNTILNKYTSMAKADDVSSHHITLKEKCSDLLNFPLLPFQNLELIELKEGESNLPPFIGCMDRMQVLATDIRGSTQEALKGGLPELERLMRHGTGQANLIQTLMRQIGIKILIEPGGDGTNGVIPSRPTHPLGRLLLEISKSLAQEEGKMELRVAYGDRCFLELLSRMLVDAASAENEATVNEIIDKFHNETRLEIRQSESGLKPGGQFIETLERTMKNNPDGCSLKRSNPINPQTFDTQHALKLIHDSFRMLPSFRLNSGDVCPNSYISYDGTRKDIIAQCLEIQGAYLPEELRNFDVKKLSPPLYLTPTSLRNFWKHLGVISQLENANPELVTVYIPSSEILLFGKSEMTESERGFTGNPEIFMAAPLGKILKLLCKTDPDLRDELLNERNSILYKQIADSIKGEATIQKAVYSAVNKYAVALYNRMMLISDSNPSKEKLIRDLKAVTQYCTRVLKQQEELPIAQ
jgi:hypothetical protein